MIVRKAERAEDIEIIQRLARSTWPSTYGSILTTEQIEYMLDQSYNTETLKGQMESGHCFLIAEQDSEAIGFAGFSIDTDKAVAKLHKLYVSPLVQQSGSGKALITEVVRICKEAGAGKLQLNVNRYNKAKGFYEKQGFVVIREEDIAIGQGYYMNDFVMERSL